MHKFSVYFYSISKYIYTHMPKLEHKWMQYYINAYPFTFMVYCTKCLKKHEVFKFLFQWYSTFKFTPTSFYLYSLTLLAEIKLFNIGIEEKIYHIFVLYLWKWGLVKSCDIFFQNKLMNNFFLDWPLRMHTQYQSTWHHPSLLLMSEVWFHFFHIHKTIHPWICITNSSSLDLKR